MKQLKTVVMALLVAGVAARAQEPSVKVGDPCPPLAFEGLLGAPNGAVASLEKLHGNVVVLEFWATWCAPCLAAFPHLNKLVDEFKDEPVRFIAVTDENEDKVRACVAKHAIRTWIGVDTDRSVMNGIGIQAIPRTIVVGKDGVIAAVISPQELTRDRLRRYVEGKRDEVEPSQSGRPESAASSPARSDGPASASPKPLFQITVREATRSGGWARGTNTLEFRGTALASVLAVLHDLPSRIWVAGPPDLLDKKIAVKAEVPMEAATRLLSLVGEALRVSFGFEESLKEVETEVYVVTAPAGPGRDLKKPSGGDLGHSSEDVGILVGANANLRGLTNEIEQRLGRPLVDETGLKGSFDWDLRYTEGDKESIVTAMKDQLGLVATATRRTIKMVVVTPVAAKGEPAK